MDADRKRESTRERRKINTEQSGKNETTRKEIITEGLESIARKNKVKVKQAK
jgi:hypothetical protein